MKMYGILLKDLSTDLWERFYGVCYSQDGKYLTSAVASGVKELETALRQRVAKIKGEYTFVADIEKLPPALKECVDKKERQFSLPT